MPLGECVGRKCKCLLHSVNVPTPSQQPSSFPFPLPRGHVSGFLICGRFGEVEVNSFPSAVARATSRQHLHTERFIDASRLTRIVPRLPSLDPLHLLCVQTSTSTHGHTTRVQTLARELFDFQQYDPSPYPRCTCCFLLFNNHAPLRPVLVVRSPRPTISRHG